MERLKADFHTHTSDDPYDPIDHSAETLIIAAAARGVQVLAITCHCALAYDAYLAEFARRRGILLIPGIEMSIEGKHVVILNPHATHLKAKTFEDLRAAGPQDAAIIAPHPYYPGRASLHGKLAAYIDVFHAIEFSCFYTWGVGFNGKAKRAAKRFGLPMVGNSDTHVMPYHDTTFTWVEADANVDSVIAAIREGRVEVETRRRPLKAIFSMILYSFRTEGKLRAGEKPAW